MTFSGSHWSGIGLGSPVSESAFCLVAAALWARIVWLGGARGAPKGGLPATEGLPGAGPWTRTCRWTQSGWGGSPRGGTCGTEVWHPFHSSGTMSLILVSSLEPVQVRPRRQVWCMLQGAGAHLTWAFILSLDSARVASLGQGPHQARHLLAWPLSPKDTVVV